VCDGRFYVNHCDVKETAYDIILFADIFLVFVRERKILLPTLFFQNRYISSVPVWYLLSNIFIYSFTCRNSKPLDILSLYSLCYYWKGDHNWTFVIPPGINVASINHHFIWKGVCIYAFRTIIAYYNVFYYY